jgi:FHA domain
MNANDSDSPSSPAQRPSTEIVGALDYLDQSFMDGRAFAVLLSDTPNLAADVVRRFLKTHDQQLRCLQLPAPTDSAHTFLQTLLIELGFDPIESTVDDLQRLLLVVFRQAQNETARCIVLLEQAQELGPRVFEALRDLLRNLATLRPTPLFILTGTQALQRVLDSRGMASVAHLTRLRFDTARGAPSETAEPPSQDLRALESPVDSPRTERASFTVMLEDRLIDRIDVGTDRLLIGRSAHNDVTLPGRYVSRHHAMIVPAPEGLTLMDLKSTNGTFVNSRAVRARILQDGDWVSIGNYRLRYTDPRPQTAALSLAMADPQGLAETFVMRSLQGIGPADEDDEHNADSKLTGA